MATALSGIRACVFDAYGTLFDCAAAAAGCADVLGDRTGPLTALWRYKQLQYPGCAGDGRRARFCAGDARTRQSAAEGAVDGPLPHARGLSRKSRRC